MRICFAIISYRLPLSISLKKIVKIYMFGCETWIPAVKEEHSLRVFKNRMLRRIF